MSHGRFRNLDALGLDPGVRSTSGIQHVEKLDFMKERNKVLKERAQTKDVKKEVQKQENRKQEDHEDRKQEDKEDRKQEAIQFLFIESS